MTRAQRTRSSSAVSVGMVVAILAFMASARAAEPPKVMPGPKIGEAAPSFQLRTLAGDMVRLDHIAYKGKEKAWAKKKPVLIDFFRTDCKPCIKEMPEVLKLHERYAARGLEVIVIALLEEQEGRPRLERYVADQKLPFKIVVDDAEFVAQKYLGKELTLPNMFLIDKEGIVRGRVMMLQEDLEKALGDGLAQVVGK